MNAVNPQAILLARESRGLTQSELSSKMALSQGTLSKYETGQMSVPKVDLVKFSSVLNFPTSFFTQGAMDIESIDSVHFFRKRQSVGARLLRQQEAYLRIIRLQVQTLFRYIEIEQEPDFPFFDVSEYEGEPSEVAKTIRQSWSIPKGPINNLSEEIEHRGGILFLGDFATSKIDAVSVRLEGSRPLFFVNELMPPDRIRFSLAHEIGHLLLHNRPRLDQEEEADQFASEFLMPRADIAPFLRDVQFEQLFDLKKVWKVSVAALIRRTRDLGFISEHTYRRWYTRLSRLGYRKCEPIEIPRESPRLLNRILDVYFTELEYTLSDLCNLLRVSEEDFTNTFKVDIGPPKIRSQPVLRVVD